jgi:TniQ
MTNDHENAHRPLPVILRPVVDELLSSWLVRHAAYYGVTGSFFAKWLMLGTRNLSALDHRLGLAQVARLSEKLRCDPITLIAMTFVDAPGRSAELICRGRSPQICRACADRHAREGASGAVPKHWRKAWRVTCPACGVPLSDTNERPDAHETLLDTSPFGRLWPEALAGEAIIERFLRGDSSFKSSPVALMRALLVQTWRPCGANGRDPAMGWALGTLFPEFDELSRGPSNEGSTTRQLQPCPSLFGPRFWRASRARWPIPPFSTPSGMTRYLGDEGRLNVYGKRPGSTLMQREKPSNVRISPSRYSQVKWLSCREVPYSQAKRV